MMDHKLNSSTLLARFKRKGGEGIFTKIIKDIDGSFLEYDLGEGEVPLIYFNPDNDNKAILITNQRIIEKEHVMLLSELYDVNIMIKEEYMNGVKSKDQYTLLSLVDFQHNKHIIKVEKGLPFWGILNVMHIIAGNNRLDLNRK